MAADQESADFGSGLRHARERKGISLRKIADDTKISMAALEALERNDVSRLPGGIFSRSFVRAFASEVGLDPEATVDEFVRRFPQDSVTAGHPPSTQIDEDDPFDGGRLALALGLKLVAFSVPIAVLLVYLGMNGRGVARRTESPVTQETIAGPASSPDSAGGLALFEGLRVEVVAIRACSLSVAIDGQASTSLALGEAGRRTFDAERELSMWVSDASALKWHIDGVPGRPLGRTGEPATIRLTMDNYREFLDAR